MVVAVLNFSSERSRMARLAWLLRGHIRYVIWAVLATLVGVGAVLLLLDIALGWTVLGMTTLPVMLQTWYHRELEPLKSNENPHSIDDMLAGDVLGRLGAQPTTEQLLSIVGTTPGGYFFAARYGISANMLQNIISGEHVSLESVWREAYDICDSLALNTITAGVIVVAAIRASRQHQMILDYVKLSDEDLVGGVQWQHRIYSLIERQRAPRNDGGIARDWSFGYAPLLAQFGVNISEQVARSRPYPVWIGSHKLALERLVEAFASGARQNAALIGTVGVGRSTVVRQFADRLLDDQSGVPSSLRYRQVFVLDAAALIAAAPGRGELEGLVMQIFGEAYAARNIIICLEDTQLFLEEGIGSVDLTNVLLPIIEAGNLKLILTMDEQRFLQLSQRNPSLATSLNRINISEATERETIAVMQDQLIMTEFQRKITYTYQSLLEAYRLSLRYIYDTAMPGRAVHLMGAAAEYAEDGLVTVRSVQQAVEGTLNVKVGVASGRDERDRLLNLENLIHERMINQEQAVTAVCNAIRRARTGVRNQDRPIGTFLFVGPTGVGKTELAKALAAVYFDAEDSLIRLDMNEFVRANDVERLIADGADNATSLTAQVMKRPFSVVLFDEIEKAHPQVLSTLLQLLDEGILRDIKNREVSFRDAIIIATSNAGAERVQEYADRGYDSSHTQERIVDELLRDGRFKPEFINRFDEIVVFYPLNKAELVQIVDLLIDGINTTLEPQKIRVTLSHDAKQILVDKGYDPRLGARPMRRVVQRVVESVLAKQVLSGSVSAGDTYEVGAEQIQRALSGEED